MALPVLLVASLAVSLVDAIVPNAFLGTRAIPRIPILETPDIANLKNIQSHYFDQLIDHSNPSFGTFQQRYWTNSEYHEAGSPIILMTPGAANAENYTGYLTNETINGVIAQQQNGTIVLLEHRFFGNSNPYDNLTSQSLEVLTIQQVIDDLVYFATNVDMRTLGSDNVESNTTQWVLVGGGYAGALASWTMANKPGVFRAGYASSAVVEAITDFYGYFTPILEYMPKNCSADVQRVIEHLNEIYAENDTAAIQNMQYVFGFDLTHTDDFAAVLQQNLLDWQALSPSSGQSPQFFSFCDALEVQDDVNSTAIGWGLPYASIAWGLFWKYTYYADLCGNIDPETCLGTYDTGEEFWTRVTVNNDIRSWFWIVCNEFGGFTVGPPEGQPALASRILQHTYLERQCVNMFPDKFSSLPSPSTAQVNNMYGGWNINVDRLFFANGRRDPWREATVSASGANRGSTAMQPIYVSDGSHASDMITANGNVDATVLAVQKAALEHMRTWLA